MKISLFFENVLRNKVERPKGRKFCTGTVQKQTVFCLKFFSYVFK